MTSYKDDDKTDYSVSLGFSDPELWLIKNARRAGKTRKVFRLTLQEYTELSWEDILEIEKVVFDD